MRLSDRFSVNSPNAARNIILAGHGMGLVGDFMVRDHLADGRLVRVLPEYRTVAQPIYAAFADKTYMPAKLRGFLDHLVAALKGEQSEPD